MTTHKILIVSSRHSDVNFWAESLEEILDIPIIPVQSQQIPILELRDVYSLIIVDSVSERPQNSYTSAVKLCQRIRNRSDNPLILLCTDDAEQNLVDAYAIGVDECIVKPITLELLTAKMRSWLRWTSQSSTAQPGSELTSINSVTRSIVS